jgi:hypothetical protein
MFDKAAKRQAKARVGCGGTGGLMPEPRWAPVFVSEPSTVEAVKQAILNILKSGPKDRPMKLVDLLMRYTNIQFDPKNFTESFLLDMLKAWPDASLTSLLKDMAGADSALLLLNIPTVDKSWKYVAEDSVSWGGITGRGYIIRTEAPSDIGKGSPGCVDTIPHQPA